MFFFFFVQFGIKSHYNLIILLSRMPKFSVKIYRGY